MKRALLLVNLGTPKSTDPQDVGQYLTEFLTDKNVIDLPYPIRQILVRALIVPKRKFASAKKYETVWRKDGSPLMVFTQNLTQKLDRQLGDTDVFFAMRYGDPSIKEILQKMTAYEEIIVLPLYPQDTKSSYLTAKEEVQKQAEKFGLSQKLRFIPPFYDQDFYIESMAEKIRTETEFKEVDFYLFSYHGIPQHHLPKSCESCKRECHDSEIIDQCYRAQCYKTTKLLVEKLGLSPEQYTTSFQSRLGKRPWIKPYTDQVIEELKVKGVKNMAVFSPSFIADCLETLEEIGIELKEEFEDGHQRRLYHIPCLNDGDHFVSNLSEFMRSQ